MKTPSWSLSLALAGALAASAAAARTTLADEPAAPAPLSESEKARVKTLVENLGSDDYGVRDAATKELIGLGERARPALEKARESDVAEVRFRADQILRRLEGRNREKPFPGARPGAVVVQPGQGSSAGGTIFLGPWAAGGGFGPGQPFGDDEIEKWLNEFRDRWSQGHQFGTMPGFHVFAGRPAKRHFQAEGADLRVQADGVRLAVTEKLGDGVSVTHVYEAKTLDAILAKRPDLRSHPGVASVLEQRKKAEEESKAAPPAQGMPPFSFHSMSQGLEIESTPGRVKVTVKEAGPDGKEETKTYESTDLETLKKEHPELADKLGGIRFDFGTSGSGLGAGSGFGGMGGLRWEPSPRSDATSTDGLTGPFGIGLRATPDAKGVAVVAVRAGSEAAKLGLKTGDVIRTINGTPVTFDDGPTSARELIRAAKDGAMSLEVFRDGALLILKR